MATPERGRVTEPHAAVELVQAWQGRCKDLANHRHCHHRAHYPMRHLWSAVQEDNRHDVIHAAQCRFVQSVGQVSLEGFEWGFIL